MSVREKNVITGIETVREYTQKELDSIAGMKAIADAAAAAYASRTIEEKLKALGLTVDDIKAAVSK